MTKEEIEAAYKAKTWLVWERHVRPHILVTIDRLFPDGTLGLKGPERYHNVGHRSLRLATPQDMLRLS